MAFKDVTTLGSNLHYPTMDMIKEAARATGGIRGWLSSADKRYERAVKQGIEAIQKGDKRNITPEVVRLVTNSEQAPELEQRILELAQGMQGIPTVHYIQEKPKPSRPTKIADISAVQRFEAACGLRRLIARGSFPLIIAGAFDGQILKDEAYKAKVHKAGLEMDNVSFGEMAWQGEASLPGYKATQRILGEEMFGGVLEGRHPKLFGRDIVDWWAWRDNHVKEDGVHPLVYTRFVDMEVQKNNTVEISRGTTGKDLARRIESDLYRFAHLGIRQEEHQIRRVKLLEGAATAGDHRIRGVYRDVFIGFDWVTNLYSSGDGKRAKWYHYIQAILEQDPGFLVDVVHTVFPEVFQIYATGINVIEENRRAYGRAVELSLPDYGIDSEARKELPQKTPGDIYDIGKELRGDSPLIAVDAFEQALASNQLHRGKQRWGHYYAAKCYEDIGNVEQAIHHANATIALKKKGDNAAKYAARILERLQ